jgi:uncharacterized protein YwqG
MPQFLESIVATPQLSRVSETIRQLARPTVRLHATCVEEAALALGTSKFGGYPDLPDALSWPVSLHTQKWFSRDVSAEIALPFLAQLACSELKPYDVSGLLPDEGRLYFFYAGCQQATLYDDDGGAHREFMYDGSSLFRVLWWPDESTPLQRQTPPANLVTNVNSENGAYHACSLRFETEWTLPRVETCWIGEPGDVLTDEEWEIYSELCHEATVYPRHLLLGHSDDSQPYAIEGGYQLVRAEFWPELPPATASTAEQQTNRLLLQIDAADETGMWFGRGGPVYFGIRDEDLSSRDFSKVWAQTQ